MMGFPVSWRGGAVALLLGGALSGCEKKPEANPKPPKKEIAAERASQQRLALNHLVSVLRELAAAPPSAAERPAARAAAILTKLRSVPAADLPVPLQPPWQEMTTVLEATAAGPDPSAGLRQRGEAAAAALNAALAAEGLTDFRF